jgi:hypothetical protein
MQEGGPVVPALCFGLPTIQHAPPKIPTNGSLWTGLSEIKHPVEVNGTIPLVTSILLPVSIMRSLHKTVYIFEYALTKKDHNLYVMPGGQTREVLALLTREGPFASCSRQSDPNTARPRCEHS